MSKEELLAFAGKQAKQAYRYRGRFSEVSKRNGLFEWMGGLSEEWFG